MGFMAFIAAVEWTVSAASRTDGALPSGRGSAHTSRNRKAHPSPRTVLVTEDDEDLRCLMAMMLEGEGYEVSTARHGREALEKVEAGMPDLILLDMRMPVMNGWEFAAEYHHRYREHARRAPIVVVTAAENVAKRAQQIRADGYLTKPFTQEQLLRTVAAHGASPTPGGGGSGAAPT